MTEHLAPGPIPLSDFGLFHMVDGEYSRAMPASTAEVAAIVTHAGSAGRRVCPRGGGHSLHGGSVPRSDEIVIQLDGLRRFEVRSDRSILVGGGASLWDVHDMLAPWGGRLPVVNNGSSGPTVGGFVAAGGLGSDSDVHGGFWQNVQGIEVVDGLGRTRWIDRSDPEFPWHFGAQGRLGIVTAAELDVVPWDFHEKPDRRYEGSTSGIDRRPDAKPASLPRAPRPGVLELPAGAHGEVPCFHPPEIPRFPRVGEELEGSMTYWVTLMVPMDRREEALGALATLQARHAHAFAFLPVFSYVMVHRDLHAPLCSPGPVDFTALFLWGKVPAATHAGRAAILALEAEFCELILDHAFTRYHQTEFVGEQMPFERYYGSDVWGRLRALAQTVDPAGVLRGGRSPFATQLG